MKSKLVSLIVAFMFIAFCGHSQRYLTVSLGKRNSVDLTIAGTGLFANVNYNRIVHVSKSYFINTSVGVGYVPYFLGASFPHQMSFNFGKLNDFLEIGIGGTYFYGNSSSSSISSGVFSYAVNPTIGYRRHIDNEWVFKAYAMAMMHLAGEQYVSGYPVIPYVGLSFGRRF